MENVLWPDKDCSIKLQILRLKDVHIWQVDHSGEGFLSEHSVCDSYLLYSVYFYNIIIIIITLITNHSGIYRYFFIQLCNTRCFSELYVLNHLSHVLWALWNFQSFLSDGFKFRADPLKKHTKY